MTEQVVVEVSFWICIEIYRILMSACLWVKKMKVILHRPLHISSGIIPLNRLRLRPSTSLRLSWCCI